MRRVILYQFFDPQGIVDDFVHHSLRGLRAHAELLVVVSRSPLDPQQRDRLERVADQVWECPDAESDGAAVEAALDRLGPDAIAEYDELLLTDCSYFGPVGSFDEVFARADADPGTDFWGLTEDARAETASLDGHWLALRRRILDSDMFRPFRSDDLPLAERLHAAGHTSRALFPASGRSSQQPALDEPATLLRDGCPVVSRSALSRDPLQLEHRAVIGREVVSLMARAGYPTDLVHSHLARTGQPRAVATNLGLLEVLPDVDLGYDRERPLRVVAVAHIYYPEMTDEILDRFETLPAGWDLVVTTPEAERATAIREVLDRRGVAGDVRLVDNRGRDISAFYLGCRDLIEGDSYDLIVKLHSKKSPQDASGVGDFFKRHLFENLLASPGYTANVLRLFQQHPSLGMVFPPVVHVGYPTMGHAWFLNKEPAAREAERLGIHVPFDDSTPVSAYGSMFVARPAALRPMLRGGYDYGDFPDDTGYTDGALTHVLERLVSYGCLSEGLHVREVLTSELAAVNYRFLEYKHQAIATYLAGYPADQVAELRRLRRDEIKLRKLVAREQRRKRRAKAQAQAPSRQAARAAADPPRRRSVLSRVLRPRGGGARGRQGPGPTP